MELREFRFSDLPRLTELQKQGFPEENAFYGIQPEEIAKLVRRLARPQYRIMIGLMRLFGRVPFRFLVADDSGRMVATTILTFDSKSGYVSMVMVDPASRRRGYARQLLERARALSRRRGKPFIVLDVLSGNAPAIALYESIGYRRLRSATAMSRDAPFEGAPPAAAGIRPFTKSDVEPLLRIARAQTPGPIAEVLPVERTALAGAGWSSRMFQSASASWVIDRGQGPEAFLSSTTTKVTDAAHLMLPVLAEGVPDELAQALVRTGLAWVGAQGGRRAAAVVHEENAPARRTLLACGFTDGLTLLTLYRPVD